MSSLTRTSSFGEIERDHEEEHRSAGADPECHVGRSLTSFRPIPRHDAAYAAGAPDMASDAEIEPNHARRFDVRAGNAAAPPVLRRSCREKPGFWLIGPTRWARLGVALIAIRARLRHHTHIVHQQCTICVWQKCEPTSSSRTATLTRSWTDMAFERKPKPLTWRLDIWRDSRSAEVRRWRCEALELSERSPATSRPEGQLDPR
jgi:hypothetical protein